MSDLTAMVDDEVMTSASGPTRVRDRTRGALLLAAIDVLSDNPTAALGEVATAAGVARSTLHRYFPDRAALLEGIENYVEVQYEQAVEQARTHEGTGLAAYLRIVDELLERIDSLGWWMRAHCDDDVDDFDCEADRGILAVVQRGQQDRTMDPGFTPAWLVTVTWSLLSSAYRDMRHGHLPRREVRDMCRAALVKVAANASASGEGSPFGAR